MSSQTSLTYENTRGRRYLANKYDSIYSYDSPSDTLYDFLVEWHEHITSVSYEVDSAKSSIQLEVE